MKNKKKYFNRLNRIYDEYKYREDVLKGNFTNLYMSLSLSIAFFGSIMVFLSNSDSDIDVFVLYSFLFLLLPVFTYMFGLLFCYNLFAITKGGAVVIKLEKNIIKLQMKLYKKADYVGWDIAEKRKTIGRVLVYGTILMFYILLPIFSIIWGIIVVIQKQLNCMAICFIIVSIILYIIYIIFMTIILLEMKFFYNKFQKNHIYNTNKNTDL